MDRLQKILNIQRKLQVNTYKFNYNLPKHKQIEWSRYYGIRMIGEVYELLRELNIDFQTKPDKFDRNKMIAECVDCFKFLSNILLINDVNASEFFAHFIKKTKINIKIARGEKDLNNRRKIKL